MIAPNTVLVGDCIKQLQKHPGAFADLVFADPPFNIGYKYDMYEDRKKYKEYYNWTVQWITACRDALKPTGSFWIAIGDDYAAEVRIIARDLDLHLRNWVIWHYTFGQSTKNKFARSHTHLFYFVKDPTDFTFNDKAVRTFSDRQRVYKDKRANKEGKIPDDVWSAFPRVCGTFRERETWHPCQMPETLLARIIRVSSNPQELVLDPFAGSGTTLAAARKLSRDYVGIELSCSYVTKIKERLQTITPMSEVEGERNGKWPEAHIQELKGLYVEAGVPTERLHKNRDLLAAFVQQFNWRLEQSGSTTTVRTVEETWVQLERLRKKGTLGKVRVHATESQRDAFRPLQRQFFEEAGAT